MSVNKGGQCPQRINDEEGRPLSVLPAKTGYWEGHFFVNRGESRQKVVRCYTLQSSSQCLARCRVGQGLSGLYLVRQLGKLTDSSGGTAQVGAGATSTLRSRGGGRRRHGRQNKARTP